MKVIKVHLQIKLSEMSQSNEQIHLGQRMSMGLSEL